MLVEAVVIPGIRKGAEREVGGVKSENIMIKKDFVEER